MTYKYNLAGALTEETYPSGRVVHHNYAPDGKPAATSSRVTANRPFKAYAQNFTYNAAGAVTDMQLGNMRWESTEFNARLQPVKIALGTTAGADDMLDLAYGYGSSQDNGNVMSQTISVDDVGSVHGFLAEQTYTYDELNRLKSATEMNTPNTGSQSQSWKQTYSFDRFGNRRFDTTSGATTTIPGGCSTAVCNPTFDLSNNRFADVEGYDYDDAGNITEDADGKKFVYDGESKQKSFGTGGDDDNGGTYFYDGDGRRVKKQVGTEVTILVDNAAGKLVAEYATTASSSPLVNYLTADHLGSPRINTDSTGAIIARHDYMPFGEEISTVGNRGTAFSYGGDNVSQKFTKKERDSENGLDYFINRYYLSTLARFTSADPIPMTSQRPADPQKLNLYVYVRNNPLRFIDPNGLELYATGDARDRFVAELEKASGLKLKVDEKTGKVTIAELAKGKSSLAAKALTKIIGDKRVVEVNAIKGDGVKDQMRFARDSKDGKQTIDYSTVDKISKENGFSSESITLHETAEAFVSKINNVSDRRADFIQSHMSAIWFENLVRPTDSPRSFAPDRVELSPDNLGRSSQAFVVVVDFTTHVEKITRDVKSGEILDVRVEKKQ